MNNGQLVDVLIIDGVSERDFYVWADKDMKEIMESIQGVSNVFSDMETCEYHVYIDPRYDIEWIKREVEAQIKINMNS